MNEHQTRQKRFGDKRSRSVVCVAHCLLNQNSISEGTATHSGAVKEVIELLVNADVGIVQMPCPELICLGLDRGNVHESLLSVIEENCRIREALKRPSNMKRIQLLVQFLIFQFLEYQKYGFDIKGIIGINRSPSCGVDSTSKNNQEISGEGVFIEMLRRKTLQYGLRMQIVGIKPCEPKRMVQVVSELVFGPG